MILIQPHLLLLLLVAGAVGSSTVSADDDGFSFILHDSELDGVREIQPDGRVVHDNETQMFGVGHTFYSRPFRFKNSTAGDAFSFSTSFVFGIVPENPLYTFHGMTFAIAPSKQVIDAASSQHLGLFNRTNDGNLSNHVVAIELDTFRNLELGDMDGNHVGLDINSVVSVFAVSAGYYKDDDGKFENITLSSSQEIRAWVDYDGVKKQLDITLAPLKLKKPLRPLVSWKKDLSPFLLQDMYVGFTSATGVLKQTFYVVGWSFQMNGEAQELDISKIPPLPLKKKSTRKKRLILAIGLSVGGLLVLSSVTIVTIVMFQIRKRKYAEVLEGWEVQYGPHRFSYKDLYTATKGFKESELLGKGGFGQVYKGTLPELGAPVAVKKIWHESGQGMKEFVAEIATIGRLRHPNLVRLLGYCRRKGELFLVYDYMPNASLDNFLFNSKPESSLTWNQRLKIIIDVAEALAYLHEEWVEVIIHRDIKASNVLLDAELNAKLGDFGLARFGNNGNDAKTTHLAGTLGYIAPELARKGKATTATDIFAFGAFCLEVACGRRPVELQGRQDAVILVEWVMECWFKEELLKAVDPKLMNEFDREEMEMVLKVGLLCSHSVPAVRPSMSQILQFLRKSSPLPKDLDSVLEIREDYSGRLGDASTSTYFSQIQYATASAPITEAFISVGR
ncbi:L-type lectin-domain containing receptor kinase V.9-like [Cynara cardunculus var. scolymus]|uniref:non-specific serine/threonine protein kinase n=1 Tax=Cynara cardunculus var. scolymus TaxID=59895 RepID=A0A118K1V8_CYNCS|nr:L-type lectin-domain containing receptor kinase V.9-like [Cynara cardunculus var. scolymus]KVI03376.1 Concanavalin A-like lectin/glucanase superfamily [Cynara cardunculus var. scolymus]